MCTRDAAYCWHPYSAINSSVPVFPVESASGATLTLADGKQLLDGMASWWCAIHGYNHPVLNKAVHTQLNKMSHVMFGGLTHEPAIDLAELLVDITPNNLSTVFFSDSGSVSVEVAMKMAIQYWQSQQQRDKQKFITIKGGYHGDTFATMSVCDPDNGMHTVFSGTLAEQYFTEKPNARFGEACTHDDISHLEQLLANSHQHIAALILEPIVQGAGGMYFYAADYLKQASELCKKYHVLLICDEIATGFGRTGKLFACEHAGVAPDIMCVGKSLTGGYMTLAATLTTDTIAHAISNAPPGVFMHGPTFMANPLACAVALASIQLLLTSDWQENIQRIETQLVKGFAPCQQLHNVQDVRVLGAIGVVEMKQPVDMQLIQQQFVDAGVWVRPFGQLVYVMPPYIMTNQQLEFLCDAIFNVLNAYHAQ